jgi:hypothetical protein
MIKSQDSEICNNERRVVIQAQVEDSDVTEANSYKPLQLLQTHTPSEYCIYALRAHRNKALARGGVRERNVQPRIVGCSA